MHKFGEILQLVISLWLLGLAAAMLSAGGRASWQANLSYVTQPFRWVGKLLSSIGYAIGGACRRLAAGVWGWILGRLTQW